jgi:aspartate/methionine/tyrosine aminotransferase
MNNEIDVPGTDFFIDLGFGSPEKTAEVLLHPAFLAEAFKNESTRRYPPDHIDFFTLKDVQEVLQPRKTFDVPDNIRGIPTTGALGGTFLAVTALEKAVGLFNKYSEPKISASVMLPVPTFGYLAQCIDQAGLAHLAPHLRERHLWKLPIGELKRSLKDGVSQNLVFGMLMDISPQNPGGDVRTLQDAEERYVAVREFAKPQAQFLAHCLGGETECDRLRSHDARLNEAFGILAHPIILENNTYLGSEMGNECVASYWELHRKHPEIKHHLISLFSVSKAMGAPKLRAGVLFCDSAKNPAHSAIAKTAQFAMSGTSVCSRAALEVTFDKIHPFHHGIEGVKSVPETIAGWRERLYVKSTAAELMINGASTFPIIDEARPVIESLMLSDEMADPWSGSRPLLKGNVLRNFRRAQGVRVMKKPTAGMYQQLEFDPDFWWPRVLDYLPDSGRDKLPNSLHDLLKMNFGLRFADPAFTLYRCERNPVFRLNCDAPLKDVIRGLHRLRNPDRFAPQANYQRSFHPMLQPHC